MVECQCGSGLSEVAWVSCVHWVVLAPLAFAPTVHCSVVGEVNTVYIV